MALETLLNAQQEAAEYLQVDAEQVAALQQVTTYELGVIDVDGVRGNAYRAHCGPVGLIGKGGIRFAHYPSPGFERGDVQGLSAEMRSKLSLRGLHDTFKGAKGVVGIDLSAFPPHEQHAAIRETMVQFATLMYRAGLAGPESDVPAGDVRTNGHTDAYAEVYRRLSQDPKWRASITGKTGDGGLPFRTAATGFGGYVAQHTLHQKLYGDDRVTTTALQGAGNVGGWYALEASLDPSIRLAAISDVDGLMTTSDDQGFRLSPEMIEGVCDNPNFSGPKIKTLADMLRQEGQQVEVTENPSDILAYPADDLVLAAMGNVITDDNVGKLGVQRAIIELANGPTQATPHRQLTEKGIIIVPDILGNSAGVDCSVEEWRANMSGGSYAPSTPEVRSQLQKSTVHLMHQTFEMAARMGTPDLRVAAATLSMSRMLAAQGVCLPQEIAHLTA